MENCVPDPQGVTPPLTPAERAAYETLYVSCYQSALEKVRFTLDDPDVAEDIVQQTFLKIWCNWSTVAGLAPQVQRGYVLTAVRNTAKDELRHRLSHPGGTPTSLDQPTNASQAGPEALRGGPGSPYNPPDGDPESDPERVLLGREALDAVLAEEGDSRLRRLEILLLAKGYTPAETAARLRFEALHHPKDKQAQHYLHATPSSVKMRRARHRARLQHTSDAEPPAEDIP